MLICVLNDFEKKGSLRMNDFLSLADWRKKVFGPNRNLEIFIQEIDKIRSIPSKFDFLQLGNDEEVES